MSKDHFSAQAAAYARHRPGYPPELFHWLAAQAPGQELAWDCGCGSGQAALGLAGHFRRVHATDLSEAQLAAAAPHPAVAYALAPAHASGLPDGSAELVCVAQALHWFDLAAFLAEAGRVLKPGGLLALWCYGRLRVAPAVDAVLQPFYAERLKPYWPPERRLVDEAYASLSFPYAELPAPAFAMTARWSLDRLRGYLGTWSAVAACRRAEGADPLAELEPALAEAWGEEAECIIRWPLALRAGRKPA